MPWSLISPVIDHSVHALCARPYPGHKKGCPNIGKPSCPPEYPTLECMLDLTKPIFAIFNVFDLAGHISKMRQKHPNWSERQLYNCLFWQPKARKALKGEIREFIRAHTGAVIIKSPEAAGLNVTASLATAGIQLEWPPRIKAYQVVIAGSLKP